MARKPRKKAAKKKPRNNGNGGRNSSGQFAKGNKCGKGSLGNTNVHARELKKALISAVTEKDIALIAEKLLTKAKAGDIHSIKELFDRLWGRATQEVDIGVEHGITDELSNILGLIDGSSKGKLPNKEEGEDAGK